MKEEMSSNNGKLHFFIFKKNREGTVCKAYKNVINFMKFYNLNVCYSFTLPSSSEQTK